MHNIMRYQEQGEIATGLLFFERKRYRIKG